DHLKRYLLASREIPSACFLTFCSLIYRGTDVSIENMHQGFTHVFESTFESTGGVKEYIEHPAHVEFANQFLPVLEKALMIDYKPASVN
ncbi:hypothetical protein BS78_07G143400, partial [Paspalum vaginatum]